MKPRYAFQTRTSTINCRRFLLDVFRLMAPCYSKPVVSTPRVRALKSICYFKIKFNEFFDASWAIVWTSPTFKVDPFFMEGEYRVFSWEKFLILWNNQLIKKYNWRNKEKCKIELIFILLHYNVSRSRHNVLLFLLYCFFFDFVKKKRIKIICK